MRKILILCCFLPIMASAHQYNDARSLSVYQELCAKEQDPIKRHQYCQVLNQSDLSNSQFQVLRQDIAIG